MGDTVAVPVGDRTKVMIKDTIIKDTILIMDRTKVIIKDTIIKVKISTKDTTIMDMSKAAMIITAVMAIAVAIRVKILAMDWRKAQKNQLMAIMIQNSAQNILKMVILISRVTILIDQVATILRDQQVMVQSQKMR